MGELRPCLQEISPGFVGWIQACLGFSLHPPTSFLPSLHPLLSHTHFRCPLLCVEQAQGYRSHLVPLLSELPGCRGDRRGKWWLGHCGNGCHEWCELAGFGVCRGDLWPASVSLWRYPLSSDLKDCWRKLDEDVGKGIPGRGSYTCKV